MNKVVKGIIISFFAAIPVLSACNSANRTEPADANPTLSKSPGYSAEPTGNKSEPTMESNTASAAASNNNTQNPGQPTPTPMKTDTKATNTPTGTKSSQTPTPIAAPTPTLRPASTPYPTQYTFKEKSQLTNLGSNAVPNPFIKPDGTTVQNLQQWNEQREYIKQMLSFYVYGTIPYFGVKSVAQVSDAADPTLSSDSGIRTRMVKIYYDNTRFVEVRINYPASQNKKYPVIMRFEDQMGFRFSFEKNAVQSNNYVVVAINHKSVYPDAGTAGSAHMAEAKAIMAWACAASLTIDYLETLPFIKTDSILLAGHSRTGKAAICAAVYDDRIAIVAPNSSGAGGASGFRKFTDSGSQAIGLAADEPTWVAGRLKDFTGSSGSLLNKVDNINYLPLDMHFARAVIAPRVILCTESKDGAESAWAGPKSTYVMWAAADPVYKMFGKEENNLISIRAGEHDQLPSDYDVMMSVADHYFLGKSLNRNPLRDSSYFLQASSYIKYGNPF